MKDGRSNNIEAGKAKTLEGENRLEFFKSRLKEMVEKYIWITVPALVQYSEDWITDQIELDRISRGAKNTNRVLEAELRKNLIKESSIHQNKKYMRVIRDYKGEQNRKKKAQEHNTSNEKFEGMDIMEMASLLYDAEEENRLLKDIANKYEEKIQVLGKMIGAGLDTEAISPSTNEEDLKELKASRLVALEIIDYLYENGAIVTKNGYTHVSIDLLSSKEILPAELFGKLFKEAIK